MFENQSKKFSLPLDLGNDDFSILASLKAADWREHESEGQLAVDVAQTAEELIVVATMAGTLPEKVELHLHNDLLTIRGERSSPIEEKAEHFYQECYWGKFSRTIVLPVDVKAEMARAQYKNGVLVVRLPKSDTQNKIPIMVIEE